MNKQSVASHPPIDYESEDDGFSSSDEEDSAEIYTVRAHLIVAHQDTQAPELTGILDAIAPYAHRAISVACDNMFHLRLTIMTVMAIKDWSMATSEKKTINQQPQMVDAFTSTSLHLVPSTPWFKTYLTPFTLSMLPGALRKVNHMLIVRMQAICISNMHDAWKTSQSQMRPDKWKRDFDIHFFRTYLSPHANAMLPTAVVRFNQVLLKHIQAAAFAQIHTMWTTSTRPGLLEGPPALSTLKGEARQPNSENNFTWHSEAIQGSVQGSWSATSYVHFSKYQCANLIYAKSSATICSR